MTQSRQIIVVDDDDGVLHLLRTLLERDGADAVTCAKHDLATRQLIDDPPSALVIDVRLRPPCVGWSIITALRCSPAARHLAIVAMTAESDPAPEQAAALLALRVRRIDKRELAGGILGALADAGAMAGERAVGA